MRPTGLVMRRARRRMRVEEPGPTLWYVTPGQPIVIGYATSPAISLIVYQLNLETEEPPVEVICRTEKTSEAGPYWLTATMCGRGTVWFEWRQPGATELQKILVHADDEPDTEVSRAEDAARARRCQMIWELMYITRCAEEIVDRVCVAVGNDATLALHAFAVAAHILGLCDGDVARTRTRLLRLNKHQGSREVGKIMAALNITTPAEDIPDILRGALLVLGRRED